MLPTYKQTDTAYNRDALPHLKVKKTTPFFPYPPDTPFFFFFSAASNPKMETWS